MKTQILAAIGETELQPVASLAAALAATAIQHAKDFRQLHLFTAVGGKLEAAAAAPKHAA